MIIRSLLCVLLVAPVSQVGIASTITLDSFNSAADFGPNGIIISSSHTGTPTSVASDIAGFPGEVRFTQTVSTGGGGLYGHFTSATFDPSSSGTANFIDYSVELRDPDLGSRPDRATTSISLLLRQNGTVFAGPDLDPDDNLVGYLQYNGRLFASDFEEKDTTPFGTISGSNPDFSSGVIEFGIGTKSATGSSVITPVRVADLRNLSYTVDFAPVPEPSALLGFASLFAVGLMQRFRQTD